MKTSYKFIQASCEIIQLDHPILYLHSTICDHILKVVSNIELLAISPVFQNKTDYILYSFVNKNSIKLP